MRLTHGRVDEFRYASNMLAAFQRFQREAGLPSLYDGLIPLLIRQILFGMCKVNEADVEAVISSDATGMLRASYLGCSIACVWPLQFLIFDYAADAIMASLPADAADSGLVSLAVSLLSGAIAGVASAIISQPADVVLSRVAQGDGSRREVGKLPGSVNQFALIRNAAVDINADLGDHSS